MKNLPRLLDQLQLPSDLRNLELQQLNRLAQEIRTELIDTVSKNGGHLAPNLGVVELTLALHSIFNSPLDKIIWDVGHQAYVHKLLTGRKDKFKTIRCFGGISGFPKRSESEHDAFGTGHSSTSISAALAYAKARDIKGEHCNVVAVIGDGSMSGGMAFEALNHAGHLGTNLIVVLNDNEMSISPNVGALASHLSKLRAAPTYFKLKEDIDTLLRKIPAIGGRMAKTAEKIKDSLKYLVVAGIFFEELGFTYLGPIDGHNIAVLKKVLTNAKNIRGPVLVHVVTQKGKGYQPAENNPDKFHGIGQFDIATGKPIKKKSIPTYSNVFGQTILDLAEKNEKIVAITAAMVDGTGLKPFAQKYPDRFFDVGIAEQHAVTFAAGLASAGLRPVVAIYSTFFQRAYDQIIHDVCLQELPVVFIIDRGGLVGEDGATHHGVFDYSYLRLIPNITMMAPKDENELKNMLYTALNCSGPVAIRYPRGSGYGVKIEKKYKLIGNKIEQLRTGSDATLIGIGSTVYPALRAANILAADGIETSVINARYIKPLDEEGIVEIVRKSSLIVTIEENTILGGFGSSVLELLSNNKLNNCIIERIGIPDQFVEHGDRSILLNLCDLTSDKIAERVKLCLQRKEQIHNYNCAGMGK